LHLLHQQVLLAELGFLLLDSCITLCHLFTQALVFFFNRHACTLLGFTTFGKSPANLGSYLFYWMFFCDSISTV
jgi:hypothetical protein